MMRCEYVWFIDPIDGTINFSTEIPLFSTSIALKKNNETIFGFIYDYSIDRFNMMICDENEFNEIFGSKDKKDDLLKQYGKSLILITDKEGIQYYDGIKLNSFYTKNYDKILKVGMKDVFIGEFVKNLIEKEDLNIAIKDALKIITMGEDYE